MLIAFIPVQHLRGVEMQSDEMPRKFTYGIIGVGPVGGILAAHLARSGEKVVPVDILKNHLNKIRDEGLRISGYTDLKTRIKDVCYSISELKRHDVDVVFVAVKACILEKIIPELKEAIKPQTHVVSYQNGLDTERVLAEHFGEDRVLRVVINYAGNFVENGHIKMSFFNKPNYIGTISTETEEFAKRLAQVMTSATLDTEFTKEIRKYVWEKVILNSAMSALCAVTKQRMKEAMEFDPTRKIIEGLTREGIMVARACGYEYGEDFFHFCIDYLQKAGYHKPSMLIDVENRRPTEIEFLNGKIVECGLEHGVEVPYNLTITNLVKAIENQYLR